MVIDPSAVGHQSGAERRRLGEGQGAAEERRGARRERAQPNSVPDSRARDEDLLRVK